MCALVSECAFVCVSVCARSQCRALEAYGNCGLPTGLLGRVCASGSGSESLSLGSVHPFYLAWCVCMCARAALPVITQLCVRPRCEPRGFQQHGLFSTTLEANRESEQETEGKTESRRYKFSPEPSS